MKISVIIPVYNAEKYIPVCAGALLGQTYGDLEIIFVNDGSSDRSYELCLECAAAAAGSGKEVKVIDKSRSEGAGPARNSGLDAATGDYIMFLDADDVPLPEMAEKLLSAAVESGCDVCVCGYETFVEGSENAEHEILRPGTHKYVTKDEVRDFFTGYFPEGIAGYLWNKIYRASVIRENNIRFPDMRRLQDGMFNVSFFGAAVSCCTIDDVLYRYRLNAQTDMFRKCPPDYYDLIKRFAENYIEVKKSWGIGGDRKINDFFLNETGTCIENTVSPQWDMSRGERKEYMKRLSDDIFLKNIFISGDHEIGRYRKMLIKLTLKKHFGTSIIAVRFKTRFKMTFKRAFYYVKRTAGNGKI